MCKGKEVKTSKKRKRADMELSEQLTSMLSIHDDKVDKARLGW